MVIRMVSVSILDLKRIIMTKMQFLVDIVYNIHICGKYEHSNQNLRCIWKDLEKYILVRNIYQI